MLGREVTQPLQLMRGVPEEQAPMQEFVEQVQLEMKKAHEIARQTLQGSQMRQKRDYEIHANAATDAIGDVVLLMNSASKVGQCRKLAALWKGPFVIVQVLTPVLYRIASSKKDWVVHHDRLKPYHDDPLLLWIRRKRHQVLDRQKPGDTKKNSDQFKIDTNSLLQQPKYCICNGPDDGSFMIACDFCDEWFHGNYVGVTEKQGQKIDLYVCPECKRKRFVF